jgi:hypothetical protein
LLHGPGNIPGGFLGLPPHPHAAPPPRAGGGPDRRFGPAGR